MWRLEGPRLDATEGVTLGGAEIAAGTKWAPHAESVGEDLRVSAAGTSAVIVSLG